MKNRDDKTNFHSPFAGEGTVYLLISLVFVIALAMVVFIRYVLL